MPRLLYSGLFFMALGKENAYCLPHTFAWSTINNGSLIIVTLLTKSTEQFLKLSIDFLLPKDLNSDLVARV